MEVVERFFSFPTEYIFYAKARGRDFELLKRTNRRYYTPGLRPDSGPRLHFLKLPHLRMHHDWIDFSRKTFVKYSTFLWTLLQKRL